MSTNFRALTAIQVHALFDGRLEQFGIHEHFAPEKSDSEARILTDGTNFVWVFHDSVHVERLKVYGLNNPIFILDVLEDVFGTTLVSEHQPQFWGFATEAEWEEDLAKYSKEAEDKVYIELMKFVRDEPN